MGQGGGSKESGGGDWQKKKWGGGGGGWKQNKFGKNKNNKVFPEKTIWVGDIPEGATFKELKALGDQCGGCKWAEVYKYKGKNTGAIAFASEAEAVVAISSLNGALIGGQVITVDAWDKKSK